MLDQVQLVLAIGFKVSSELNAGTLDEIAT